MKHCKIIYKQYLQREERNPALIHKKSEKQILKSYQSISTLSIRGKSFEK